MEQPPARGSLAREAETVIRRLQGVTATRVEVEQNGRIDQVHVLGSPDRTARVLVADVIAALAAELGVTVEPRQVRVAVLRPGETQPGPAPARARLKFVGMTVTTLRHSLEVKVQLEHDGLTYEGGATGPNDATHRLELVGEASLRAIETYLRTERIFYLRIAMLVPLATNQAVLVLVTWAGPEEELLTGSAVVKDDPREAVVRAVLDATNRPVSWLGAR